MGNKPLGVIIIAGFFLVRSIALPILMIQQGGSILDLGSVDKILLHVECISCLLVAYGLFFCHRWAWWLASFLLIFNTVTSIYEWTQINSVLVSLELSSMAIINHSIKYVGFILLQLVALLYLFREVIFDYYGFGLNTWIKKILILVAANTIAVSAFYLL